MTYPPEPTDEYLPIGELRLHPCDELDLRWWFCESAGALGVQSNHGAIVAMIERGLSAGVPDSHEAAIARVQHAERERCIRETLLLVQRDHRLTLGLVYGLDALRFPHEKRETEMLGAYALLCLNTESLTRWTRTAPSRKDVGRLCKVAQGGDARAKAAMDAVRQECTRAMIVAHGEYNRAKRVKAGQTGAPTGSIS